MDTLKKFVGYYTPYKLLFFTNDKKVILGNLFYIGAALIFMYIIRYFYEYFITF